MTAWRHAELPSFPGMCAGCLESMAEDSMTDYPYGIQRPCAAPIPDPSSPCGFCGLVDDYAHGQWTEPEDAAEPGAACYHDPRPGCHPHVPTLCQSCGHAIERTR